MHEISQRVQDALEQGENRAVVRHAIDEACRDYTAEYLGMLRGGHWTIAHAHDVLMNRTGIDSLDLMQISGLAKAMQIYQSQN